MKFFFCCLLLFSGTLFAQPIDAANYQSALKAFYEDEATSPLQKDELITFPGISFFPISETYVVKAKVIRLKGQKKFKMPTTGPIQQWYKKYALLEFTLNGKQHQLFAYQNINNLRGSQEAKMLFIPFLDQTNGVTTYGGGRYLDLQIPSTEEIELDFNLAYQPYCAYTVGYSCPLVPLENTLDTAVKAGVKFQQDEN